MRLRWACAACLSALLAVHAQESELPATAAEAVEESAASPATHDATSALAATTSTAVTASRSETTQLAHSILATSSSVDPASQSAGEPTLTGTPLSSIDEAATQSSSTVGTASSSSSTTSVESATQAIQSPEAESSSQTAAGPAASEASPPEFLSFNEWREKYAHNKQNDQQSRRVKKNAQRQRQGASGNGDGTAFDGDGADIGSLFSSETTQIVYEGQSDEGDIVVQLDANGDIQRATVVPAPTDSPAAYVESAKPEKGDPGSPLQPLPNVGTGLPDDPLLSLRDRSNYALFECAAMVHRSSKESKGASSILVEKKDRYMLTPCEAEQKFVELELCDEIRIDTIVLANFEFFSSMFKHFQIKVSMNYPGRPDEWHDLGTFRARNQRGVQVFHPKPLFGFYRYMRIDFLSHYGSEYYCPVSLLRVYGLTQLDAWRRDEEKAKALEAALAEQAAEQQEDEEELLAIDPDETIPAIDDLPTQTIAITSTATSEVTLPGASTALSSEPTPTIASKSIGASATEPAASSSESTSTVADSASLPINATVPVAMENLATAVVSNATSSTLSETLPSTPTPSTSTSAATSVSSSLTTALPLTTSRNETSPIEAPASSTSVAPETSVTSTETRTTVNTSSSTVVESASTPTTTATTTTATPSRPPTQAVTAEPQRIPQIPVPPPVQQGDSIYGTIMKRLTSLEHNQTLSMHYIEAQSSMLREAFLRVERRLGEVETSRLTNDNLVRAALLDLEKQRLDLDREKLVLSSQVKLLTKEVVLERRLGIAQLLALLALFVFVGFTRGSPSTPFVNLANTASVLRRRSLKRHKSSDGRSTTKRTAAMFDSDDAVSPHDRAGSSSSGASASTSRQEGGTMPSPFLRATSPVFRSASLSLSAKRSTSMSTKRAPRRHYYPVASSASQASAGLRLTKGLPRTSTMPVRHGSAPPEDVDSAFRLDDSTLPPPLSPRSKSTSGPVTVPRVRSMKKMAAVTGSGGLTRSSTASSLYATPQPTYGRTASDGVNGLWSDEELSVDEDRLVDSPSRSGVLPDSVRTNEPGVIEDLGRPLDPSPSPPPEIEEPGTTSQGPQEGSSKH